MPSFEEQNKGKIEFLDIPGVNMLWSKIDEPDFVGILSAYRVLEPLGFEASKEALAYIQDELAKLKKKVEETGKSKSPFKREYTWKCRVVGNHILNVPIEFVKENADVIQWMMLSTNFNFNKWPDAINLYKGEISLAILEQNKSWIDASPDSELGAIKTYWKMVIDNHPEKESYEFKAKMLDEIELNK